MIDTEKTELIDDEAPRLIGEDLLPREEAGSKSRLLDLVPSEESVWGVFSEKQKQQLDAWREQLDVDNLGYTPFRDADFAEAFIKNIPEEDQFKYVQSTNNYKIFDRGQHVGEFDPNFVLVTRRAVSSHEPKPEQYWTDEHRVARCGLKNEIRGDQRAFSVIMVSTLGKLYEHGLDDSDDWRGGASDGEIKLNKEPFNKSDILFMYKPKCEIEDLKGHIRQGGRKSEVIDKLRDAYQGQPADESPPEYVDLDINWNLEPSVDDDEIDWS